MRLIDADVLELRKFTAAGSMSEYGRGWNDALAAVVENAPTIEAEPVRHGYWIECDYKHMEHGFIETDVNGGLCCSECRTGFKKSELRIKLHCPNCGAKMDGDGA